MNSIMPDEIRNIDQMQVPDQIRTVYDYIKYMHEQIEFWGSGRGKSMQSMEQLMKQGFIHAGDNINVGAYNQYIGTMRAGELRFMIPISKPILASEAQLYAVNPGSEQINLAFNGTLLNLSFSDFSSINTQISDMGVSVRMTFNSTPSGLTNGTLVGIQTTAIRMQFT